MNDGYFVYFLGLCPEGIDTKPLILTNSSFFSNSSRVFSLMIIQKTFCFGVFRKFFHAAALGSVERRARTHRFFRLNNAIKSKQRWNTSDRPSSRFHLTITARPYRSTIINN